MPYQLKYATATGTSTHIRIPMPLATATDYATNADWTPAAGDVKVSIDDGAEANITALPTYSNGKWVFTFTGAELTGKRICVKVVDSATKVVADNFFDIETFGHASAMWAWDPTDGRALGLSSLNALAPFSSSVNDAGATDTSFVTSLTSAETDFHKGQLLVFTSGALAGHAELISAYNGTTKAVTLLRALPSAPANGVTFVTLSVAGQRLPDFFGALGTDFRPLVSADAHTGGVTVAAIGTGGIVAGSFAGGAITSSAFAAGAITGTVLHATATASIGAASADAVWDEQRSEHANAGSFGQGVASVQGNVTGSVATISTGGITNTSLASSAITAIAGGAADAVWDESRTGHTNAGTFGFYLDAAVSSAGAGGLTAADVWGYVGTRALTDKAGFSLASTGLNAVLVESGLDLRQAASVLLAYICGTLTDAGESSPIIRNPAGTAIRVQVTTDAAGNRSGIVLSPYVLP